MKQDEGLPVGVKVIIGFHLLSFLLPGVLWIVAAWGSIYLCRNRRLLN